MEDKGKLLDHYLREAAKIEERLVEEKDLDKALIKLLEADRDRWMAFAEKLDC